MDINDRKIFVIFCQIFANELEGKTLKQKVKLFRAHYKGRDTMEGAVSDALNQMGADIPSFLVIDYQESFDYLDDTHVLVDEDGEYVADPNEGGYLFTVPKVGVEIAPV